MLKKSKQKNNSLDGIFYPKSIAVIGASNEKTKIGGFIFSQIINLNNITKYPINVKSSTVQGLKAYERVSKIGKNVDLAIIVIPALFVIDSVKDCIKAGVKNIVIVSAGFKEVGEEGKKREEELKKLIQDEGINLIGPNCLGILNAENYLNCSFANEVPSFGDTALISQSGAVIDAIIDWSFKNNIGFSKIISLGNMAGIDALSILHYLKNDPKTKSIVFYMETLERGEEFGEVLREVSKKKPVIIIKPGNSENAKKAIGSHTGSLAQDNILIETLISENNGILVKNLNELFNVLIGLKANFATNNKLCILTNAGGPGVIATDGFENTSFELYRFSEKEKKQMNFLPKEASLNNPIDILGDAKSDRYIETLKVLDKNKNIDNIFVLLTPQMMTDNENIAKGILEISKKSKKCIYSCFLGDKEIKSSINIFNKENFANFQTPNEAIKAMNYIYNYKNFKYENKFFDFDVDEKKIEKIRSKIVGKKGLLDYSTSREILKSLNINIPKKIVFRTAEEIIMHKIYDNKKYVLKADSSKLIHKKDIGGVVLGIDKDNFKKEAIWLFGNVMKQSSDFTITLEEEIKGNEVIVGLKSDENLGNFIMFGMGGTYVSIFKDVNFALCPLREKTAISLVKKSKVYEILKGFRGSKPIHFEKLFQVLIRLSYLQKIYPEIKEVDFNPLICNSEGVFAVDVKLIL